MIPTAVSNANSTMESITETPSSTALRIDTANVDQGLRQAQGHRSRPAVTAPAPRPDGTHIWTKLL